MHRMSTGTMTGCLHLYLTTLAGTVIQIQVPVSIHHTWEMLEEYLVEHACLPETQSTCVKVKMLNLRRLVNRVLPATLLEWNANNIEVMWCLAMSYCFVTAAPDCHFGTAVMERILVTSPPSKGRREMSRHQPMPSLNLYLALCRPRLTNDPKEPCSPLLALWAVAPTVHLANFLGILNMVSPSLL